MQKESGYYQQQPGTQMIYSQLQQLPNLSSQQNTLMQGPMQTQGRPTYVNSAENQSIRPMGGGRVPQYSSYPSTYTQQGQPTDTGYQNHAYVSAQTQFVQNNMQQFTPGYSNYAPPRSSQYSPVYVVQQGVVQQGNFTNNVVLAPQMPANQSHMIQNQPPRQQQQHMYSQMPTNVHTSQPPPMLQQQTQTEVPSQKKRTVIKLVDPTTGKDLTSEILKKKAPSSVPPAVNPDEGIKAKTVALFAAQIAEKIASTQPPQSEAIVIKPPPAPSVTAVAEEKVPANVVVSPDVIDAPVDASDILTEASPKIGDTEGIGVETTEEEVVLDENVKSVQPIKDDLNKLATSVKEAIEVVESPPVEIKSVNDADTVGAGDQSSDVALPPPMQHDPTPVLMEDAVVDDIVKKLNDLDLPENKRDNTQEVINPARNAEEQIAESKGIEPEAKLAEITCEVSELQDRGRDEVDKIVLPKTDKIIEQEMTNYVGKVAEVETKAQTVVGSEIEEQVIEIAAVATTTTTTTTEAIPENVIVPSEKVIKETTSEKEIVKDAIPKEEYAVKKEKNVKSGKNKNDKTSRKEDSPVPVKKEMPKKDAPVKESIKKEAAPVIKKDIQRNDSVEKEAKKKVEKKEPVKKDNVKKDSSTKEDAIRRFEPAFSNSAQFKSTVPTPVKETHAKPKEPMKSKEPVKPFEVSRSSSMEIVKNIEPIKKAEVQRMDLAEPIDDPIKTSTTVNPVAKKKKGKGRFKDFDAKDSVNNDMLSAFVDAPKEMEIQPEPVKVIEKPPEEATWEDKENSIEKEEIRGEDAEEPEIVPKRVETKIIKGEGSNNDEKHQYDREFLLRFQFAPICTSKPAGLPNIDIVLDEAHAPTKALVPGQHIQASNDFMPTFMRQGSGGGRNIPTAGGRASRDKGRGSQTNAPRQQKVITIPHLEKLELKKTENAWVRPSQVEKDMSTEEKSSAEVSRNVRSILNKLTPQKFKTLVNQMIELKIDNATKLETAISLIFEKAVSEPGFSVAYANMCRVLTDNFNKVPATNEPNAPIVTFRKILLNKCQTEFEKESSDERELEEERNRTFEKEEERKAHLLKLDYKELMNRRRTLGNIRFIGELYKLKMISEPIMHDCIYKLLRSEKQDSLEDQLECLCKLLTTIGKDIDHEKAKPRVDQYFEQMQRIIDKKKISSRIKFALRDVIDLRGNNWVPRRDEGNPKTIDQIHREAQQKEKKEEMARQQDKLSKKLEPRGGRGGRDSPLTRPGASQNQNSSQKDGWNTVANKSTRQIVSAPVDASKLRFKKTDTSEISLGPGGRPGAWLKGASGGGSGSRSGSSGSNTPTNEHDQRANRYDALTDSSVAPGSLDHKGRNDTRQGGLQPPRKGLGGRNDRSDALRAVRDMTGRGSRNQSPARGSRNHSPATHSSRNHSPAPAPAPAPSREYEDSGINYSSRGHTSTPPADAVTPERMKKVTKSTVEEYLSLKDLKEAMLCIKELNSPGLHHIFVEECITIVIEKKTDHRRSAAFLLNKMIREGVLNIAQVCKGLAHVIEFAPDFSVDIPHIYKYLGEVLGPIIHDETFPLNKLKETLEPLIKINKAGVVMAEALSAAVQIAGKEEFIAALWSNSKITWDQLLSSGENVEQFAKDRKMEFTLKSSHSSMGNSSSQPLSHTSIIQEEMLRILNRINNNNTNNEELITYIERHTKLSERSTAPFIQILTTSVCRSSIIKDSSNNCQCRKDILGKRKHILLKYIDKKKDLELQSLYALQQLVQDLTHPKDLLHTFFDELFEGDIISEETFFIWESSKDFPVGKGPALSSVKNFLTWLKNADEESNDEESPNPPRNA